MNQNFKTSILFLIFNRPDTTERVFSAIREIRPKQLFIAGDGPRADRPDDIEKCKQTREIVSKINWPCEVKTLFRDKNLGCKIAVSSAIDWFFENVDEGIILEDDCLPDQSFFKFCEILLEHYRDDKRVMMISGDNFQFGRNRGGGGYYFSNCCHIWGWATWKRAWEYYDVELKFLFQFIEQQQIKNIFKEKKVQKYFLKILSKVREGKIDTWDYQWSYAVWRQNGLSILPNVNLVSNIGLGGEATHTKLLDKFVNQGTGRIENIIHPDFILPDKEADNFYFDSLPINFRQKIIKKIKYLYNR